MNRHEEILSVALIDACSLGRLDVVKILLQRGANINYINNVGINCLLSSMVKFHDNVTVFLLDYGADPNMVFFYDDIVSTPFIEAINYSNPYIVKKFIEYGADLEGNLDFNLYPIIQAIKRQDENILQVLLDARIGLNYSLNIFTEAFSYPNKNIFKQLLLYYKGGFNLEEEFYPLHLSIIDNKYELVDLLLYLGIDVDGYNEDGYTPIQLAIKYKNPKIISKILDYQPNLKKEHLNTGMSVLDFIKSTKRKDTFNNNYMEENQPNKIIKRI